MENNLITTIIAIVSGVSAGFFLIGIYEWNVKKKPSTGKESEATTSSAPRYQHH